MFAIGFLGLGLPDHFLSDLLATAGFGLILVLLVGVGLKVIDVIWTRLDLEEQVQKGNVAAGVVMGATVFGLCYAMAAVVSAILG